MRTNKLWTYARQLFILAGQLFLLWLFDEAGHIIVSYLGIAFPGNVLGMILLFVLLMVRVIPLKWVDYASSLLVKHLALFFIPLAVGFMVYGGLFAEYGIAIVISIIASAASGLVVTGWVSQKLAKRKQYVDRKGELAQWNG